MAGMTAPLGSSQTQALASQHTQTIPLLLRELGVSLLVSTYQAGQLILLRDQPQGLNTHFLPMGKPMGMAARGSQLAIGSDCQVWQYWNMPAVAPKLQPSGSHDAAYLPRHSHITGDIDIHEMAWADDGELWLVNTKMSCLCTLAPEHSVIPRWRPPFVSQYDLGDRCHLNGLAMRDGKPAYVTALGATDTPGGWRVNKASGGLLMRLSDEKILVDGLSMPHSPRWYDGRLWYLESGAGQLCTLDPDTGEKTVIAEMPGFTRGLDFVGRYAFVGLSQVRETAVFAGLPLTERVSERQCGVWVIDLVERKIVGFVVFTGKVQEIFAVIALPWRQPGVLELTDPLLRSSYSIPDAAIQSFAMPEATDSQLADATVLHRKGDFAQAIAAYRQILAEQPDHAVVCFQLGMALVDAAQWQEAATVLGDVVTAQPGNAEAQNSLGLVWVRLGDDVRAIEHFNLAIAADRQYAQAYFNRALSRLRLGDYRQGWEDYEWRWQLPAFHPFQCPQPKWQGEDISDKVLLVHTEQGNGDAMQFARFLTLAAKRCRKLIVVCGENLKAVLATVEGVAEVRVPGPLPADLFDAFCPLLSLPQVLDINLDNLPTQIPYLHVPARTLVPDLPGDGFKVGLVWTGSSTQKENQRRSCPLETLLSLTDLPGIQLYSLQKPLGDGEAELLASHGVEDLEADGTGYGYTAAYVHKLDLVISVCTSVAHLAGALGEPVWVLLAKHSDWRWGLTGETSPWYPDMHLIRQQTEGDWPELIARVRVELARVSRPSLEDQARD